MTESEGHGMALAVDSSSPTTLVAGLDTAQLPSPELAMYSPQLTTWGGPTLEQASPSSYPLLLEEDTTMADPSGGMAEVSADMMGCPVCDEDAVGGLVLEEAPVDGLLDQDAVDSLVLEEYRDGDPPPDSPMLDEHNPVGDPVPK